jgi:hypothetical protein
MEKIYTKNENSTTSSKPIKPKVETIHFLLNFSKILEIERSKKIGIIDYLLN